MTDWITAIASLVAALAAGYGVVQAMATYRDSLRVRQLSALVELENSFQRTLPFFVTLEDDRTYASVIRPVIERSLRDQNLDSGQMQVQADLERAIRFFYIFWVRVGFLKDSADLLAVYRYYLAQLGKRREVCSYVERYYPGLLESLTAADAQRTPRS